MSSPSAIGRFCLPSLKLGLSRSVRRYTVSRDLFGSSIPMAFLPGTTAIRALIALMERATSSASAITREDFTPGAGSSSNRVTTGPGRTCVIRPLTPNSFRMRIRWSARSSSRCSSTVPVRAGGVTRRSREGRPALFTRGALGVSRRWRRCVRGASGCAFDSGLVSASRGASACSASRWDFE